LQLSDGRYVRVTSTDDGELMPVEDRSSRSNLAADTIHGNSVQSARGRQRARLRTVHLVNLDDRWALKFVNQACALHRDDQVEHD
jgi:hypothetical protein